MRTPKDVPNELKRLINAIVKRDGDCESWLNGYNRDPWGFTWYGFRMICEPLFCWAGNLIGYSIRYRGYEIRVDNDLSVVKILDE